MAASHLERQILMDQIGEILLQLKTTELEAQLALREIARIALTHEIEDLEKDPLHKREAELRRDRVLVEWGEIMTELQELRARASARIY